MDAPEGASVYTLKRHRSTFILSRHASELFRTKWITRWANDVHPQDNLFDRLGLMIPSGMVHKRRPCGRSFIRRDRFRKISRGKH
jgi:hypothetical protein